MKIVITGGHHSSALPVIEHLLKEHTGIEIYWFGHKSTSKGDKNLTLEYREITALGIPFFNLHAGKFYRTFNIVRLLLIPYGFIQAFFLHLKIKPDAILSYGGYLSVPTVLSGWILGIPSITHEQTVTIGWANKLVSIFAKKVLISWEYSRKFFPPKKTVYSGIPLRNSIFETRSNAFNSDNVLPTIYITAGKTGSHKINLLIGSILPELLSFSNVIHQCGDHSQFGDYDKLSKMYESFGNLPLGKYYLRKFIFSDEIGEALNKSSLVISRAGAHTISELFALKKPSILIPIPWVSHNEQNKNAQMLKDYGLAEIVDEDSITPEALISLVRTVLKNLEMYKLNNPEAEKLIRTDASLIITNELLALSKKK